MLRHRQPPSRQANFSRTIVSFILNAGSLPRADSFADFKFPKTDGRSFLISAFTKKMSNGISLKRSWLIYSKSANAAYCFCCALFQRGRCCSLSSINGNRDWTHLHANLDAHSRSRNHFLAFKEWQEYIARFKTGQTIDAQQQKLADVEKERWSKVFFRIVQCIKFLAKRSIAFRGVNERLGDPDNGNFMQLMETIDTFDSFMDEHLRLPTQTQSANRWPIHYLSSRIQNDVIASLASEIKFGDFAARTALFIRLFDHCRLHPRHFTSRANVTHYTVCAVQWRNQPVQNFLTIYWISWGERQERSMHRRLAFWNVGCDRPSRCWHAWTGIWNSFPISIRERSSSVLQPFAESRLEWRSERFWRTVWLFFNYARSFLEINQSVGNFAKACIRPIIESNFIISFWTSP